MQEARFQIKHRPGPWASIPFVAVMVDNDDMAAKIARGMADIPGVKEVRMSFAGSQQGYYYKGSK